MCALFICELAGSTEDTTGRRIDKGLVKELCHLEL